jgi:hypothetical protein
MRLLAYNFLIAALVLVSSRTARAGDIDDTVYLNDGGRIRGVVLEQSPSTGVRVRLPDGTVRSVGTADVNHVAYGRDVTEIRSTPGTTPPIRGGVGGEPLLWYVPASRTTHLGGRVFGRMQASVSPLVDLRADFGVGVLDGVHSDFATDKGALSIPVTVRLDLQLNLTSLYAIDLGLDLGVDVYRDSALQFINPGGFNGVSGGQPAFGDTGLLGLHVSPATLRFGATKQFQVAAQEGVMIFFEEGRNPAFEQTVSFTYFFGSPSGR